MFTKGGSFQEAHVTLAEKTHTAVFKLESYIIFFSEKLGTN